VSTATSFFASRWVEPPAGVEEADPAQLADGFVAAGVACGLKEDGGTDLGIVACEAESVSSAMLLTRNAAAAAPVRVCQERCDRGAVRAAVVNSGNANAATGERGYRDAVQMQEATARALDLDPALVAVAETGMIGVPLDTESVGGGIEQAASQLDRSHGRRFAEAIMTTDRVPKLCAVSAGGVTVSAQAKGAGMVQPGFATMLCFVQTDAALLDADSSLRPAVVGSFERISVDGQMSTNDAVLMQATGSSGKPLPEGLLEAVLLQLALEIVADGEGATRVARVRVSEAHDPVEADRVARAIANSPLVKTALYGRDPNWGRVAQAAGMALVGERIEELGPDRIDAAELSSPDAEAEIEVRLGRGSDSGQIYFSDLTPDYVKLNSEYTT
jgi:glutamate N-acetyltransferase/amino-acid N-acetyltransferase